MRKIELDLSRWPSGNSTWALVKGPGMRPEGWLTNWGGAGGRVEQGMLIVINSFIHGTLYCCL